MYEVSEVIYQVSLKHSPEGFAVWVPALPGCASQGDTEEEAIENIRDAILGHLEVLAELQKESGTVTRTVAINVA
jgi:predicted RNase H-like HicB family nuclease